MSELFELGKAIARQQLMIAFATEHDASAENARLFQNVATDRGSPIRFFDTEADARAWLGV